MPRRTSNQKTGKQGEAFVQALIADMGFVWNPVSEDNAVDGVIEIVDAAEQVTGARLLVQVKATQSTLGTSASTGLSIGVKRDHVDYWMRCTNPVILVRVDLGAKRAWWKDVSAWFSEPSQRKKATITFSRDADELTIATAPVLAALATPNTQALPRLSGSEELMTNLLTVRGFAPIIYSAPTGTSTREEAWARMTAANAGYDGAYSLHDEHIYSFSSLDSGPLSIFAEGPVAETPTEEWSASEDPVVLRHFVWLLNATLRSIHHEDLVFHYRKGILFYKPPAGHKSIKLKGAGARDLGRTWFTTVQSKADPTRVSYCRHYAAELHFRRYADQWYLEIDPTWHFTHDGQHDSAYDSLRIAALKRTEGQGAVRALVSNWADFLRRPAGTTLFGGGDERITFDRLAVVEADTPVDERAWKHPVLEPAEPLLALIPDEP